MRGTPQQIIEKYQSLARDRATAGDRVLSESFLQHAEHYARLLQTAQAAAAPVRREDDADSDQPTVVEGETADALAVIGGDDGDIEKSAQPDDLSSGRRPASKDGDGEEGGGRRRQRRTSRRSKDAKGDGAAAEGSVEAGSEAPSETPAETVAEAPVNGEAASEPASEPAGFESAGLESDPRRDDQPVVDGPEWIEGVAQANAS